MNQENKVVKISDVIQNQIPEFILSENENLLEFFKQYYISQEFQGSNIDLIENLVSYKNIDSFDTKNLISETTLSSDVEFFDDVINVESTNGWPKEYGLLKIDDEIITYTGITSTSFIGCIRGFSGTSSLSDENNPEFLVFSQTNTDTHISGSKVKNLSNLFLIEFFRKIKYQFTPGFEDIEFADGINAQNFVSKSNSFYKTKGTNQAFEILFKVLYNEDVKVVKPDDYCFTPSDDKWRVVETFVCKLISGDPSKITGQTLYQDDFLQYNINKAKGSIYNIEIFNIENEKFYKIRIFSGYSNNLNPKGSIEGTFSSTPRTIVVEDISENSNTITVNSTIGFPISGTLEINDLKISYTDKTNNQFLNCSGITSKILRKTDVFLDHYVYAFEENTNNVVKFKLYDVLSDIENNNILGSLDGDPIEITRFGSKETSPFLNSLVYNLPLSISCGEAVQSLTSIIRNNKKEGFSISNGTILCKNAHFLVTGDLIDIFIENSNQLLSKNIPVNVLNSNEFVIPISAVSDQIETLENFDSIEEIIGKRILIRRILKKSTYKNLNLTSNIQDSYLDEEFYYVTSNGLPEYQINPLTFETEFDVNGNVLTSTKSHNFNTGELITILKYSTSGSFSNEIGISTGVSYYVNKINNFSINLSQTKENISLPPNDREFLNFIEYDEKSNELGKVLKITLTSNSYYGQEFNSSKLFKKFPKKYKEVSLKSPTNPGSLGVFSNGVEIKNYKSFDKIYYGPIESVSVLNSGSNYNLCNPPQFKLSHKDYQNDNLLNQYNKIIPQLKGKLIGISVVDPGYDYIETPVVEITGGNNPTVITSVKMKNVINEINFNSTTKDTVVDTENDEFNFSFRHRFVSGEPVIYKTLGSTPIGIGTNPSDGYLIDNSIYYISNIGAGTSIKLAYTRDDAIKGKNLINLRTYGGGFQSFTSTIQKKAIDEVSIIQNEKDFEYKKLSFLSEDVDTLNDTITIKNHGFSTGEEVIYTIKEGGVPIEGLTTNQSYYIIKLDDDNFKLSSSKNQVNYVNLISTNFITVNYIEYAPIKVRIYGSLSVDGLSDLGYSASIIPIIKGKVVGARPEKNRSSYNFGNKNILNYEDYPEVEVIEGSNSSFEPIIVNGSIKKVIVKNSGFGYFNSFELKVTGTGFGAKLEPIISEDGNIIDVKVVNGGLNYSEYGTSISILPLGTGVKLKCNLKSYHVDEVFRYGIDNVEDGMIFGKKYSFSANTYGVYFLNNKLKKFFNIPDTPTQHSPIIGWSYDGCPIYGPFAYKNIDGSGGIVRMRSGYKYENSIGSIFQLVEEYEFKNTGNLDQYNGRFCVTPEYPDGIYAYFCTLDETNKPEFPYIIGPEYNYFPIEENFNLKINQDLNFNNSNIIKFTLPYRVEDDYYSYEYFNFYKRYNKKDIIVQKSSLGSVDSIEVFDGGDNYQIGDSVIFNNEGTFGGGASAKVSEIFGVGISTILTESTVINNVTFVSNGTSVIGIASTYHSLESNQFINISNINQNNFSQLEGFKKISVVNFTTNLTEGINSTSVSGIVTSIKVKSSIDNFDIDSNLLIGSEIVKVIGLDYKNNTVKILRNSGSPSHPESDSVKILPNKFVFENPNSNLAFSNKNDVYYFNPVESVSTGEDVTVGSGNTLTINPLGSGIPYIKYVKTGGIYLPNNKFNTGDKVIYTSGITTINTNYGLLSAFENLYITKLDNDVVGLVTSKSDIYNQSRILNYISPGSNDFHKLTTDRNVVVGDISNNYCTVITDSSHRMSKGDLIELKVISGVTTTYNVSLSNNKTLINSEINPKINLYKNDTAIFDLSDVSLSGKEFNLYSDENFSNVYFGSSDTGIIVEKTDLQLKLYVKDKIQNKLYYKVSGSVQDKSISDCNLITINDSLYNSKYEILDYTDKTFSFNLKVTPERLKYSKPSLLEYKVLSGTSIGPISKLKIISKGYNYKKLPSISKVDSILGFGCNLIAQSNTIGKIEKIKINNSQLLCPSDKTLKPESNVFSLINLNKNYTVDSLEILDGGKNYLNPPKIKLYNRIQKKVVEDFSATAVLKNNSIYEINLLTPGYGLNSSDNEIIVTNNNNGFKIIDVQITNINPYTVSLTLKTPPSGFTESNPLPISVGDEIYVEGIASTGNGFNTEESNYVPFKVSYVDPAYNSQDSAIVRYEMEFNPGIYDSENTYNAYVIPYSNIAKVKCNLKENAFLNNETVNDDLKIINNQKNSPLTNSIKVSDIKEINIGDIIIGKSSKSKGSVTQIRNFDCSFRSDSSVSETIGGVENRGYLSSNIQKLSDNDYYQKFSYSLKSKKPLSDWNSIVSDLSHISGYKKFSDLIVESVGIGTTQSIKSNTSSLVNVILSSYGDVNSIYNFDLVNEIDIEENNYEYSQLLKFNGVKLDKSLKSTDNRVLSIDDISFLFTKELIIPKITIDSSLYQDSVILKYQLYLSLASDFTGPFAYPEVFELFVTKNQEFVNMVGYSYYSDFLPTISNSSFGNFSIIQGANDPNEMTLSFEPKNPFLPIEIKAIKETCPSTVGIATTTFGYIKNVEICQEYPSNESPTQQLFYTIPSSECKSGTIIVGVSSVKNFIEKSFESSFVNTGTDILISTYSENIITDLGTIDIQENSGNLEFLFTPISGIGVTLHTNLKLITSNYAGYDTVIKSISKLSSSKVNSNSLEIGISSVSGIYGNTKYILEISQDTGITTNRSIVQINSIHFQDYLNNTLYDINGNIELSDMNFTTGYSIIENTYTLFFEPVTSADYQIIIYESNILSPIQ